MGNKSASVYQWIKSTLKSSLRMRGYKGPARNESLEYIVGCSLWELADKIEAKWDAGMNWSNHGKKGWHIDHIKPLSKFDMSDIGQVMEAYHYSNCQPAWYRDNLSKSNTEKIIDYKSRK